MKFSRENEEKHPVFRRVPHFCELGRESATSGLAWVGVKPLKALRRTCATFKQQSAFGLGVCKSFFIGVAPSGNLAPQNSGLLPCVCLQEELLSSPNSDSRKSKYVLMELMERDIFVGELRTMISLESCDPCMETT